MVLRFPFTIAAAMLLILDGCAQGGVHESFHETVAAAPPNSTKVLAVYEPWFGHPQHIKVGYSSQDPLTLKRQIEQAKRQGISGFVVDWYGDREPFLDKGYALLQSAASGQNFSVAMMYDETDKEVEEATDDALVSFDEFRSKYLAPGARGREAYLTYQGRPVIFIFPKGGHTDWNRVHAEVNKWNPAPLLIYEYGQVPFASAFDGFYAWVNPGKNGWARDGSHWGEDYLRDFYQTMRTKYADKIAVGGTWAGFDDSRASWGLGRYMSQRCGQTLADTREIAGDYAANNSLPFLLIETWNDYEEGTALERGLGKCQTGTAAGP
jgi:hypothetical protein